MREEIMIFSQQLEQRGLQQTAERMLKKGMSLDDIEEITGISKK